MLSPRRVRPLSLPALAAFLLFPGAWALASSGADAGEAAAAPLRVRVLYGTEPAPPDTEVLLYAPSPLCGTARRRTAPRAHPGADGWAVFPDVAPGRYSVSAEHPALYYASVDVLVPGEPPTLVFSEGLPLTVRVVDERGAAAAGVQIHVVSKREANGGIVIGGNDGAGYLAIRSAPSGPDGTFRFLGLTPGSYAVVAELFDGALSQGVRASPGQAAVELRLPREYPITGQVLDANGKPAAGARVVFEPPEPKAEPLDFKQPAARFERLFAPFPAKAPLGEATAGTDADAQGRFVLPLHRTAAVRVYALLDFREGPKVLVTPGTKGLELKVPADKTRTRDGATLTGRIVGPDGAPVQGARVTLDLPSGPDFDRSRFAPAEPNGTFLLEWVSPEFKAATYDAPGFAKSTVPLDLAPLKKVDLGSLRLTPFPVVRVTVLGKDGRPANGARITLEQPTGWTDLEGVGPDGTFELTRLVPGRHRLRASVERPERQTSEPVEQTFEAGKRYDVEFRLK